MSYNEEETPETHDIKIGSAEALEKHVNVVFKVVNKEEEREVTSRNSGETNRVCDFIVADDTGNIILTVWNEDIDLLQIDSVYKLSNGFVNIFRNSLRLTKGRFGTLEADETELEADTENNRSSEHVEDPRRRRRQSGGGGYGRQSSRYNRDSGSGWGR